MRDIEELLTEEGWDFVTLQDALSEYVVEHIRVKMGSLKLGELGDKPWWTMSITGKFNVKSAWDLCCFIPVKESIDHLFLTGEVAAKIWNHYFRVAGLLGPIHNLKQTIRRFTGAHKLLQYQYCETDSSSCKLVEVQY
ncbi:hypothetical protein RDI58_024270 [Solanum bulbocastanum]|uniref:Uncharacterized protein n=1 Tax=Solanum bulbocastanum TaxID=147425 RepID=A0AAN8Y5F9_SOLBU